MVDYSSLRGVKSMRRTMNLFLVNLVLILSVLVCCFEGSVNALAVNRKIDSSAPSTSSLTSATGKLPNIKGTLFGVDTEGNGIALGNWLDYGSWLVGITLAGQLYLVLWALVPIYYTLFAVTDPDELQRRSMGRNADNASTSASAEATPSVTGNPPSSSSSSASWNWQRIMKMVTLAVETYQQLDMSEIDCQKKLLCEIQQGKDFAAATARTLSNVLLYFDFFKRIPHMEDYREAIKTGQRRISSRSSADACSTFYAKCRFSMIEFNDKYRRLLHNTV